ncbi:MAG: hypothetical protein LBR95_09585 [Azoarcus sp.]|jgi:hypothetical protein|nr:hypothetical protein [Azoarcus sp.]
MTAIQRALAEFFSIYEFAEESSKRTQQILDEMAVSNLNEFRYCARNLVDFLKIAYSQQQPDDGALLEAIHRAAHAAKNAVNDTLDLVVDHACAQLRMLRAIDKEKELSYYVHTLDDVEEALGTIGNKIAISRRDLAQRLELYRQIYESEAFKTVVDFAILDNIASIRERIGIDQYHMIENRRRFWVTIVITIVIGIWGAVTGSRIC